jgi:integrase
MLTIDDAIDFACSGLAAKTREDYGRLLNRFADDFHRNWDVAKITQDDCLRFLGRSRHLAKSTQAWQETVLNSFFRKLYLARKVRRNPMEFVPRTRRPDADSLNLVTVSSHEVAAMFHAADSWPERLCVGILAYLGPRRHAAALLTMRDYDQLRARLRFHEKGGKTIWKPIPTELRNLIDSALASGAIKEPPDDYLIPPEGPTVRHPRDDRVVWRLVKKIADRAGVEAHTHSLRGAFADFYLDSGGDGKALQLLMGHTNPATTERYTRRYDREKRMEQVRELSWAAAMADNSPTSGIKQTAGTTLGESRLVGAGGFEPP